MSSVTVVSNPGSAADNYTFDAIWQFTIFCSKFEDSGIASGIPLQK